MSRKNRETNNNDFTRKGRIRLAAAILVSCTAVLLAWTSQTEHARLDSAQTGATVYASMADTAWTVGQLRDNGLRIVPSGRTDAADVLDPDQFSDSQVHRAYWIATQIPETLNQLYCWCGCENRRVHRSNLGCFEDFMAVNCDVCRGTALIAYEMVQKDETTAAEIQAAVDAQWAPAGA